MIANRLHSTVLSTALFAGALCLSPGAAPTDVAELFPVPAEGLTISVEDGSANLASLVASFERVTGEHLIITADTKAILNATTLGLQGDLVVEPEHVYSVVESLLIANRFVLTDMKREGPRMMTLSSLDSPMRSTLRSGAVFARSEDLAIYGDHPALMVQTVFVLPGLDVRTLGNSLRSMVVDPNVMQIMPIPDTCAVYAVGTGTQMNNLAQILNVAQAASTEAQEARRARIDAPEASEKQQQPQQSK